VNSGVARISYSVPVGRKCFCAPTIKTAEFEVKNRRKSITFAAYYISV